MSTNNKANSALDTPLLASYEAGSAFAIDAADYKASRLAHVTGSIPFGVKPLQVVLGSGGNSFLVVGETVLLAKLPKSRLGACPNSDTVLAFERSRAGRWQIVLEPSADSGRFPTLATATGGLARSVPAAASSVARRLPGEVATALEHYEASGQVGSLSRSDFTGSCWQVPDPHAEVISEQAAGFDARELYSPSGRTLTFPMPGGDTLVLFTLASSESIVAPAGAAVRWRHVSGAPWMSLLPAGLYGQVVESGQLEIAAVMSPGGGYRLVGAYSGITSVTGVKAKAQAPGGQPTLTSSG